MSGRSTAFLVIGLLLIISGSVFFLQGLGLVGPTSSFMFNATAWVYQGSAIAAVGVLVLAFGFWLRRSHAKANKVSDRGQLPET